MLEVFYSINLYSLSVYSILPFILVVFFIGKRHKVAITYVLIVAITWVIAYFISEYIGKWIMQTLALLYVFFLTSSENLLFKVYLKQVDNEIDSLISSDSFNYKDYEERLPITKDIQNLTKKTNSLDNLINMKIRENENLVSELVMFKDVMEKKYYEHMNLSSKDKINAKITKNFTL